MQVCFPEPPSPVHMLGSRANIRPRRPLATSQYLVGHTTGDGSASSQQQPSPPAASAGCAHYFVDPLSWMRAELEQGKLDGRLECPKCRANVGKYAWQGMRCSCGVWVVPGISLAKGRIDEVKAMAGPGGAGVGIRMPPPSSSTGRRAGQNL